MENRNGASSTDGVDPGSFRDPSGFVFRRAGRLMRQVNEVYAPHYEKLMASGLYEKLVHKKLLVSHEELPGGDGLTPEAWKVLAPEKVWFVSYPWEWCFGQLQSAALVTLAIQKLALDHGMILKDASAFNVLFRGHRPVFIDTLSFEEYIEGEPWVAYRQFCEHFVAPLALMYYRDRRLSALQRKFIGGVPLDLAAELLPWKTRFSFSLAAHIHVHARYQKKYQADRGETKKGKVSLRSLRAIVDSLEGAIRKMKLPEEETEWGDYYSDTNYSETAAAFKARFVEEAVVETAPATVWDLGGNTGRYSRVASKMGINTVSFDVDHAAVEKSFREGVSSKEENLLPLVMDFTNPSPGIGWAGEERSSLTDRGPADLGLALAVTHHLAISNNVPLGGVAAYFAALAKKLVVEFIPKEDSQVQRLLATRKDVFPNYTPDGMKAAFGKYFKTLKTSPVPESKRVLCLMERL